MTAVPSRSGPPRQGPSSRRGHGGFRIAVVGLGAVSEAHLQAYELVEGVDIVAVCDLRRDVADKIAERYGARSCTDYRVLIEAGGFELLIVLTPAATHREIVEAAARARLHVLCEKPLAVTAEDGEAMVEACRAAGVTLFYGSCYRYLPAVRTAREMIRSGAIGDVQLMTEQLIGGTGLAGYKECCPTHYPAGGPGGAEMGLVDHGIHLIDVFSWFAESDVVRVEGRGQISGAPPVSEAMAMYFESGALGLLTYNAATFSTILPNEGIFSEGRGYLADGSIAEAGSWEHEPGSISVYGTAGSLRIFHYVNALFIRDADGLRRVPLKGRPSFGHFATQLEDCIAAIRDDRAPSVGGEDGVAALKLMLDVFAETTAVDVRPASQRR